MFDFLRPKDAKTICQELKTKADQQCKKVAQYKKKTYRQKFHETHKQHEKMILYIKLLILIGMAVMAGLFHYTDFIKQHGDLFALEVLTYVCCAIAAYLLTCFLRNQSIMTFAFWKGLMTMVVFTGVVIILAELAGMNTKFMHGSSHATPTISQTPRNEYRERGLKFKEELWGKMIVGINLAFVIGLSLLHFKENDRGSFFLLMLGLLIAGVSMWISKVKNIHTELKKKGWLVEGADVSDGQVGMAIFYSTLFAIFTLIVLATSLLRYDSFKIYSYFPNNPKMCGMKRAGATVLLFTLESLIVAALFSVPILYVSSNRNKPELGHEYKIAKDKEAFLDFGMLTGKIFIFLVALQMTGLFDSYNDGFCRVEGCNVKLLPNASQCPTKVKQLVQKEATAY